MDRRNWPWKKKSSDKPMVENESVGTSLSSLASLEDQEKYKKVNYVQIPMDSYTHLTGLENHTNELKDQIKSFEDEVKDLKEKLSAVHLEIKAKESLVMQHAKVAEEAVSGWEKADAESLALKRQLESVTLFKVSAEERALHLDGALKECTREMRSVKEECEQRLHDVVIAKTIQWDQIKRQLEVKIDELNQGLLRAAAENAAFSRSLQERSNLIARISDEKSQTEAEIEILKINIQSYEKEIGALKYDLNVVSKELDIRNEEKNMSLKSAEIANKQHLEGVKKIAKLESECQRLRGLVRKKLPGPAALAQMKQEVENLGHEFTDSRTKRATAQNLIPYVSPKPEISIERWEECKRENEFLTNRLLAMEEETRTLEESLAARNSELQVSRNLCAKTLGKVKSLEAQIQMLNQQKNSPKPNPRIPIESPTSRSASYAPSATSISEDGLDDEGSSPGSRATLSSDSCRLRKIRSVHDSCKPEIVNSLKLMDDFIEVERLAAYGANGAISVSNTSDNANNCKVVERTSVEASDSADHLFVKSSTSTESGTDNQFLAVLGSKIYRIFESQNEGSNIKKVVEDIKFAIQETYRSLPQHSLSCISEVAQLDDEAVENQMLSSQNAKPATSLGKTMKQDLELAVSHIHQFIVSIIKEAVELQDICENGLVENLEEFFSSLDKFTSNETGLVEVVLKLSHILFKASDLNFSLLGGSKRRCPNFTAADCIDKVTLLKNEVDNSSSDPSEKTRIDECYQNSYSCSKTGDLLKDHLNTNFSVDITSCKCLLKELEQLKSEKADMESNLAGIKQDFENTKLELQGREKLLLELKSQLASSQSLHSLAETQLRCVTESYKSLEAHAREIEAQAKHLEEKTEDMETALSEKKQDHADALILCRDLQDKMRRSETFLSSSSSVAHTEPHAKQEREIAAAAEKLASCQETIYLLGKQLQYLQPRTDNVPNSQYGEKLQADRSLLEKTNHDISKFPEKIDIAASNASEIKPTLSFRSTVSSAPTDHTLSKSNSFSSSLKPEQEKHSRGLGRFFSSKGKNGFQKHV